MFNLDDLESWMEVSGILVVPFIAIAYINEFGLNHFSSPEKPYWLYDLICFFIIIFGSFLISRTIFKSIKILELIAFRVLPKKWYTIGSILSFFAISFISFGLLGFHKPESISHVKDTWFLAVGIYGIYLLQIHIKAIKSLARV